MRCPEDGQIREYLDGELMPRDFDSVDKHVRGCERCREAIRAQDAADRLLSDALCDRPDVEALRRAVLERLRRERDS